MERIQCEVDRCYADERAMNWRDRQHLQIGHYHFSSWIAFFVHCNGGRNFQSWRQFHEQHKWRNYAWLVSLPINLYVFQNNPAAGKWPDMALQMCFRRNLVFSYGDIWREIMDFGALQLYWVFVCFVLFFCFGLCLFWSKVCWSWNDCLFMTSEGQGGKGNNSAHLERMTSSKWFLLLAKLRIYSQESLPAISDRKNTLCAMDRYNG